MLPILRFHKLLYKLEFRGKKTTKVSQSLIAKMLRDEVIIDALGLRFKLNLRKEKNKSQSHYWEFWNSHCGGLLEILLFYSPEVSSHYWKTIDHTYLLTTAGTMDIVHSQLVKHGLEFFLFFFFFRVLKTCIIHVEPFTSASNLIWFVLFFTKKPFSSLNNLSMPNFQQHEMNFVKFQWTYKAKWFLYHDHWP